MSIVTSTRKTYGRGKSTALHSTQSVPFISERSNLFRPLAIEHIAFSPSAVSTSGRNLVVPNLGTLRAKTNSTKAVGEEVSGFSVESLMNAIPSGVVVLDNQGRIQASNPAAAELLGTLKSGHPWREVIATEFEPKRDDGHEVSLKSGKRVSLNTRSLTGGGGQLILITDLTETRKLQTQLSRHQRLSSMGKMMSSLAHQIRTPLTAALLHSDNLVNRSEGNSDAAKAGRTIISRLRNIERQIRDMLVFAKGGVTKKTQIAPSVLIEHMRDSARDLAEHYNGKIVWSDQGAAANLYCNLDALMGAFLNLLENAFQASGSNPSVSVRVNFTEAQAEANRSLLLIEVIDQGAGIDKTISDSLTEPFSTTKANGNGLGLAIVRLVCQSHGGDFSLTDNGNGATASMSIPISLKEMQA